MSGQLAEYDALHNEPSERRYFLKFVGGTAAVTKVFGNGMTIAYNATGIVDITFNHKPGVFLGLTGDPGFQATTIADVKSFIGRVGAYNTTTHAIQLRLYESGTLADLAALEWCSLELLFKTDNI